MTLGRRLLLALVGALIGAAPLGAQTGTITGRVVDATSQDGLSGATVRAASRSAVTDAEGRFTLTGVPAGTRTVRATRIGYAEGSRSVTLAAGQSVNVQIPLASQSVALQGVVAIGYGERRVRDVTGSVQAVSAEEFNTGRVVSPEQLIQGKVAGVQVVDSGEPGGGVSVRIRGGTSVNASNEPLYVIDGVPLPEGGGLSAGRNPLNFINPDDIARMSVLKDAASTAIYGSRGANGVVIIETKTGAMRGPQFTYSGSYSTSRITREPDLLSADQFRSAVQQFVPNMTQWLGNANTDWRNAVQRNGVGQEHALSVSGAAGQAMNYRLSLEYLSQDGVIRGSNTERISAALNYSHRLFENRLNVRASIRGARTDDLFTPGGVIGAATAFDPTQPIYRADGSYFEADSLFELAPNNPLAELALAIDEGRTYRSIGNVEAQYRMPFLEALSATLRLGYDVAKSERQGFLPSIMQAQQEDRVSCDREPTDPPCPTGTLSRSNPTETRGLIESFLTYTGRIDGWESDVDATAGYSFERTDGDYPSFVARGLDSDLLGPNGIPTAEEVTPDIFVRETKLASYFARLNYTFRDRYLLTLSVRRDGSSRFGPENQWGTFPAAAVAWRVSDEPFMEGVDWLSDLKLRASWGVNGNQTIGDYQWVAAYEYGDEFARVQFGNDFVTTIRPTAVDPGIKWEETTSYNVGFDYGFLDNRITGAVEYYVKNTDDLLFRVPVAAGTNLRNYVTTNIGEVRNRGLEMSINARVLDGVAGGLTWDASLNAATNRNRLLRINPFSGGGERLEVGGINGGVGNTIQVLQPGYAVNAFLVYEHRREGGRPVYGDTNGDGDTTAIDLYVDQNNDGSINDDDLRPFRSPAPSWVLGHTSQLGYRNLDLSFTLRAHLGNYVYNNSASSQGFYNILNAAGGLTNLHASVLENGFVEAQYLSDVYVEDASFLRMDNLTLGYTVPRFRGVQQMRVFGTVQNVFTLTGYSGVDPEAGLGGIDNNIYPRSRTFTAGVSIGF
jgi:TonB-dependent starch-binding outer membrane protein SusC